MLFPCKHACVLVLLCVGAMSTACRSGAASHMGEQAKRVIVLGVDGMDPALVRQYLEEGRLPNISALAKQGGFVPLGTTMPPQSPVAWSTFTTGTGPHDHGIYDFVHRDPAGMKPYLSTSRTKPARSIKIGPFTIPTASAAIELLRDGVPIWQMLSDRQIPSSFVKMPANFPPKGAANARVLSGMGTPDLLGTYGTFHVFTDDQTQTSQSPPSGGQVHGLTASEASLHGTLPGPPDPSSEQGGTFTLPVKIVRDLARDVALVRIGEAEAILSPGEWSTWLPIAYDPGITAGNVHGMVRLYLKALKPKVFLYVSPINLDPMRPAMPVSVPEHYAADVAGAVGRYYTQGMPPDTKAFSAGVLTPEEFLAQVNLVFTERIRMLHHELAQKRPGVTFVYFSSIDLISHMFWRSLSPQAPAQERTYANVIPDYYERIDGVIGTAMKEIDDDTALLVMSDHGFAPYLRKVHLNTWLARRGYLSVKTDATATGALGHIDWERTQAYALGLNQVFVNLRGRERHGTVSLGDYESLLQRLTRDLERFRDPSTGERVVTRVYHPKPGNHKNRQPDLMIGYARGFRSSDESAVGSVGDVEIEDNRDQWSGDHCMDPSHVPGVLISSIPLGKNENFSLKDFVPSLLARFGAAPPKHLEGSSFYPLLHQHLEAHHDTQIQNQAPSLAQTPSQSGR